QLKQALKLAEERAAKAEAALEDFRHRTEAELEERAESGIESERTVREELEQEREGIAALRDELASLQHRLEEVLDSERDTRSALDQRHEELVAARAEGARLATQLAESEREVGEVRKGVEEERRAGTG